MAKSVLATEMKGNLAPLADQEWTYTFKASGRGPNGENVTTEPGALMSADGFKETDSIAYSGHRTVYFETVGFRALSPSPMGGLRCGAVVWRIVGSDCAFHGASGHIPFNFCANDNGEVWDKNYARISTA